MASDLIPIKEWFKLTSIVGRIRSKELKALDEAIERYEKFGGGDARWRIEQALKAWKEKEGPGEAWKKNPRNKKYLAFERLTALLLGTDSEAAWGRVPHYMHHTFTHSRLGVVYLLSKLHARPDIFSVILEGGISIAGNVMSYQGGQVEDGGLGKTAVDFGQNLFNTAIIPSNSLMSAMNGAGTDIVGEAKGEKLNGPQREEKKKLGESIKPVFQAFITKTLEAIKQTLLSPGIYIALTRNLVNLCCKIFLSTVTAGFISGAQDLFKGLVNMADAASTRIKSYMLSRKVTIMSGHPATVVQSIKTAMNLGILQGLWETLKGAGNVALAVSTWGTAMIVGVVTAIFEMVVKLIWRLVEISKMNRIFEEARQLWRDREGAQALHKRPFAFHEWYYDRAIHCPPIAILTLNSGICGDKMVYLSMFNSQNQPITTEEFQNGVRYLDHMRVYGVGYLESCGYSFYGSDAISNSLLQHIKSHTSPQTVGDKIWGAVKTFANS